MNQTHLVMDSRTDAPVNMFVNRVSWLTHRLGAAVFEPLSGTVEKNIGPV